MIVDADTVIDPGTVMVEPLNASVAGGTVFWTLGSHDFAVGTHLSRMHLLQQVNEGKSRSQVTRVSLASDEERDCQYDWQYGYWPSKKACFLVYKHEQIILKIYLGKFYLLGTMMNSWVKTINKNSITNKSYVLWFYLKGFNGVFIMKHSTYLGSLSMLRSSVFICGGSLSDTIS